ncbi:hypothetical protein X750_28215 [Mesorhizobium sp. LNJC394B00]|nr:hypothetical protein X750_28215 [Mesorhizobium sp. LNJC394B00]
MVLGAQRLVHDLNALYPALKTAHFADQRSNQPAELSERQALNQSVVASHK